MLPIPHYHPRRLPSPYPDSRDRPLPPPLLFFLAGVLHPRFGTRSIVSTVVSGCGPGLSLQLSNLVPRLPQDTADGNRRKSVSTLYGRAKKSVASLEDDAASTTSNATATTAHGDSRDVIQGEFGAGRMGGADEGQGWGHASILCACSLSPTAATSHFRFPLVRRSSKQKVAIASWLLKVPL